MRLNLLLWQKESPTDQVIKEVSSPKKHLVCESQIAVSPKGLGYNPQRGTHVGCAIN